MADETTPVVDVNTDNLDDFNSLLNGNAEQVETEDTQPADDTGATEETGDEADTEDQETVEEETPDEPAEEEEDNGEEENILKPKKKPSVQERINELTRKVREAERREADANRRLAEKEAEREKPQTEEKRQPATNVALDADAPTPDDVNDDGEALYPLGEFDPKYIAALSRFTIRKENEAYKEEQRQATEQARADQEHTALMTAWESKLAETEKTLDDLRPTIGTLESQFADIDPQYGTYLAQTIMQMDAGPEVLYYLANHPDEASELVASGPLKATIKLGKLENDIQRALAKKEPPKPRQTTAPKPPSTTRGNNGRLTVSADTDDLDAFEKQLFQKG